MTFEEALAKLDEAGFSFASLTSFYNGWVCFIQTPRGHCASVASKSPADAVLNAIVEGQRWAAGQRRPIARESTTTSVGTTIDDLEDLI